MDSKTFMIPTMTPDDAKLLQTELQQIDGVRDVHIHQPTHSVTVTWTKPSAWEAVRRRLAQLHFTPDLPQENSV
jgi:hypothetical protein